MSLMMKTEELERWANTRADDAGRLAREIVSLRRQLDEAREAFTAAPASAAEARMKELELFLGEVAGTCLGLAMSGRDHPNPDGALMGLFEKAQALAAGPEVTP